MRSLGKPFPVFLAVLGRGSWVCGPALAKVRAYWLLSFQQQLTHSPALKGSSISPLTFSSVQLLSRVQLFATQWTATRQASLFFTNSQSSPKPMSTKSVMPSSHLILCHFLLLLPSIFLSIRVFSNKSALLKDTLLEQTNISL